MATFGGCVLASASVSSAALVHRYSFNDGTADDSVGTANLTMSPAPGMTGSSRAACSRPPAPATSRSPAPPSRARPAISRSSRSSARRHRRLTFPPSSPSTGEHVYTLTFDASADGSPTTGSFSASGRTATATLYIDGAQVAQNTGGSIDTYVLSFVGANGVNNGINGNGIFGDPSLTGSTNDFRIYDTALTPAQVAANVAAGPNAVPEPTTGVALAALGLIGFAGRRRRR